MLSAGILLSVSAHAQTFETQPIPDLPLRNVPPPAEQPSPAADQWRFSLGGGVSYRPRYEGAASNNLRFLPVLEASKGKLFISPLRGIGYNFSDDRRLEYGLRVGIGMGRKANLDPRLNGMDNIGFTPEAGLFLNFRAMPFYLSGGISTGMHGNHIEFGSGLTLPLSRQDRIRLGASTNWGDARYNRTFFSVSPAQAAASGNVLWTYDAGAGFKDYALTANWSHNFDQAWFSSAGYAIKRLVGSAQHSPLVLRPLSYSVSIALGYRF